MDASINTMIQDMGKKARAAARAIGAASPAAREKALLTLAQLLEEHRESILAANAGDVCAAEASGLSGPKLDRLRLTPAIIAEMAGACRQIAAMPEIVGALDSQTMRPNGMMVGRMRVPLGVIAMIFESRPNVTIDSAILCLKAGNSVILRGGSEALRSNVRLMELVREALKAAELPEDAAQLVPVADREAVAELCRLDKYVDVMIPRGGEALIKRVSQLATMPVLKHDKGVCHAYVDEGAECAATIPVLVNAKVQRPSTCNALECVLVHASEANTLLPALGAAMKQAGVLLKACPVSLPLLTLGGANAQPAGDDDFGREFGDLTLAVKVVSGLDAALEHIEMFGSRHTEVIFTRDMERATRFTREADASMVGVNVSTRLNDGGQLGLGAEIGISTSKLHAFGPMGVRELTTTKFVALGQGQIRQ
ncbi:glutamate-5-semialdehyde dehydrogenase [Desulfovibrio sp. OttesenSCG-928-I05]|nr:glutamate-5-semialdehyde dehydrogenase [Desulfovibrio sp. OttesenSCG-928-I05]